eukprot:CAMPEP_0114170202 /NCGR_PEP_ID=MMETSP0043_2-20121206/34008_2 /TAXON_ID=464988 /ORGANISM="Hemiselmis andersenii, Strain CCMP644" /LENGTH=53 /DNA_ID=CAMNT_0001267779 /DNA_START=65 /DNA_END=222 /DNA_ORIENTATION=-
MDAARPDEHRNRPLDDHLDLLQERLCAHTEQPLAPDPEPKGLRLVHRQPPPSL